MADPCPTVFVGSSSEREHLAVAVKEILQEGRLVVARYWRDVFKERSGSTPVEVLVDVIEEYDFGVFLLAGDDIVTLRGQKASSARDNLIFELGLFIGRLGRDRTFALIPDDLNMHVPSDLAGIGLDVWVTGDTNPSSAVRAATTRIRDRMLRTGPRRGGAPNVEESPTPTHSGTDGWLAALDAGVLIPVDPARVRLRSGVVHPVWGFGRVVEVGPADGDVIYLTVAFPGRGFAQLRTDGLFDARFA